LRNNWRRRSATRALTGLLGVLLLVLLAGCEPAAPPPPLRLGTSPWLGSEPLFLARDLGRLDPREVTLVELVDVGQVVSALLDGAIDGAAVTLAEALRITARDPNYRIVLVADYCDGADVLVAQASVPNLAALRGARIGLEDTALSAHVLKRALQQAGLSLRDIHIRMLVPGEQASAFAQREIDALVTYDPTLARVRELGGRVLFDTSSIPAEISDVVIVRADLEQDWLARRTRALLDGWFAATAYLRDEPLDAAQRLAPRLQLDAATVTAALRKTVFPDRAANGRHLAATPPGYLAVAGQLKSTLVETRELDSSAALTPLFDRRLAAALYP
jgi:NitT/TauT family transport system substrate-binding protein